jgi:hypothetical protein
MGLAARTGVATAQAPAVRNRTLEAGITLRSMCVFIFLSCADPKLSYFVVYRLLGGLFRRRMLLLRTSTARLPSLTRTTIIFLVGSLLSIHPSDRASAARVCRSPNKSPSVSSRLSSFKAPRDSSIQQSRLLHGSQSHPLPNPGLDETQHRRRMAWTDHRRQSEAFLLPLSSRGPKTFPRFLSPCGHAGTRRLPPMAWKGPRRSTSPMSRSSLLNKFCGHVIQRRHKVNRPSRPDLPLPPNPLHCPALDVPPHPLPRRLGSRTSLRPGNPATFTASLKQLLNSGPRQRMPQRRISTLHSRHCSRLVQVNRLCRCSRPTTT